MGARGKRSSADLSVVPVESQARPDPWPNLSDLEQDYWRNIVKSLPSAWFRPSDLPLLAAYCKAAVRHDDAVARLDEENAVDVNHRTGGRSMNPNFKISDMAIRQMATLATKLRICPSARYDAKQGHTQGKSSPAAKPWEFGKAAT